MNKPKKVSALPEIHLCLCVGRLCSGETHSLSDFSHASIPVIKGTMGWR